MKKLILVLVTVPFLANGMKCVTAKQTVSPACHPFKIGGKYIQTSHDHVIWFETKNLLAGRVFYRLMVSPVSNCTEAIISDIFIDPQLRNQGYAKFLMARLMHDIFINLKQENVRFGAEIDKNNVPARKVFAALGFKKYFADADDKKYFNECDIFHFNRLLQLQQEMAEKLSLVESKF